jgi:hypothetical protein
MYVIFFLSRHDVQRGCIACSAFSRFLLENKRETHCYFRRKEACRRQARCVEIISIINLPRELFADKKTTAWDSILLYKYCKFHRAHHNGDEVWQPHVEICICRVGPEPDPKTVTCAHSRLDWLLHYWSNPARGPNPTAANYEKCIRILFNINPWVAGRERSQNT